MEYTIVINDEDLKLLDEALTQLPYYKVFKLINKLNLEIDKQIKHNNKDV